MILTKANLLAVTVVGAVLALVYGMHLSPDGMFLLSLAGAVYFVPAIVARHRNVPNQGSVLVINVFLGWTLIGWVVALAMAARSRVPLTR